MTTISNVNKFGGTRSPGLLAQQISGFCLKTNTRLPHICAVFIQPSGPPITTNDSPAGMADCSLILPSSQPQMGSAHHQNHLLPQYISWKHDHMAMATDALSISWQHLVEFTSVPLGIFFQQSFRKSNENGSTRR
jgi:hypothetical protein